MTNPKGTEYENDIGMNYLVEVWGDPEIPWGDPDQPVQRARLAGIKDYGDFLGVDGWLIEARNRMKWDIRDWIRGVYMKLERHGRNIYAPWVLVFKSDKRTDMRDDYALCSAGRFFDLIKIEKAYWDLLARTKDCE